MGDGSDFIKINITNSKTDAVVFEKKFPKDMTVADLKCKLEIITGGNPGTMELELYNGDTLVCKMIDSNALLGSFPFKTGTRLHVIDSFSFTTENVPKFELTEQQYNEKQESLRHFLKKNRLGKYNDEEMKKIEEKKDQVIKEEKQKALVCAIGSRCEVSVKNQPRRRGVIMYNGELEGKRGIFIGVKYDEPLGTNDGSLEGKRYFDCQPKYGGFVTPSAVEVGDFPPEDDIEDEI